jgi:hypothetical protein
LQNKMAMMNYQNRFGYSEENTHRRWVFFLVLWAYLLYNSRS